MKYTLKLEEMMLKKEIRIYKTKEEKEPFLEWFRSLRDKLVKTRICDRLDRVELGNLGDYKMVGEGVFELRFNFGIRIYYGQIGNVVVLLLCGGDKKNQSRDIRKAQGYWREYNE